MRNLKSVLRRMTPGSLAEATRTPCYHSRDANRVAIDPGHTLREIEVQMAYLREVNGPRQHAQLIGGEVTLLGPRAHAVALAAMQRHGRKPMSMTHGDFDYEYLRQLALAHDGQPRFRFLRFAGHFDSLMLGRRGAARPLTEADLNEHRRRFVEIFERLRREHGVKFDLAHNMTVSPRNLGQVAEVVQACLGMGYGMLSFQPAARLGNPKRWRESYGEVTIDAVWRELERGAGTRLPWAHLQMGDPRCNCTAFGALAGGRWTALLDDRDRRDLGARDAFLEHFGGLDFEAPLRTRGVAITRVVVCHPPLVPMAVRWACRLARRIGVRRLLTGCPHGLTFVVHAFMDADVTRPAWEALERSEVAEDPAVRAAQERLRACSYRMAHPEQDRLIPACVQHAVLDPPENARLLGLLGRTGG